MQMQRIIALTAFGVLLGAVAQEPAPGDGAGGKAAVDRVAAEYLAAIGGGEAHRALTTRKITGTFAPGWADVPPWPFTTVHKAPDLKHTRLDIPGHGVVEEGYDGEAAWKLEPGKGAQRIRGGELNQKRRDARFSGYVDLTTEYQALTYAGQEEIGGKTYDVLAGTFEDGARERLFISADTRLLDRIERPAHTVTIEISDYRAVDGVVLAHAVVVQHQKKTVFNIKVDSITHGVEIDNAIFQMPQPGGGKGGGDSGGHRFTEGSTSVQVRTLVRGFDADGNLMLEEQELETGFLGMIEQYEKSCAQLTTLFDGDKDGVLNGTESQAARKFVFGLVGMLPYDVNGDWQMDNPEADKAWEQLVQAYDRHNDRVLRRFDRNKDGKLSAEEAAAGRE